MESFETKLKRLVETAQNERKNLTAQMEKNSTLSFEVLGKSTPCEQMQELYTLLQGMPLPCRYISVYTAYSLKEKPAIAFDATYDVERIADIEVVLEALSNEYEFVEEYKDSDHANGRTYSATIAWPDYNIELNITAWVKNLGSEGDCFRVIESAEAYTSEIKTYRWICK